MSEEATSDVAGASDEHEVEPRLREYLRTVDGELLIWVHTANEMEVSPFAVTLTTAGGLVTGTLASRAEWARVVAGSFPKSEDASLYVEHFEEIADSSASGHGDHGLTFDTAPRHIHLVDAQVWSGAQLVPSNSGVAWRGRLDQIVGWSFGRMQSSTD